MARRRLEAHISIHALREEGDLHQMGGGNKVDGISIHALREEGDLTFRGLALPGTISIHALREEGDAGTASRA